MQAVELSDRVVLEDVDALELRTAAPGVPTDASNLALRAAITLREAAGIHRGVRVTLDKRIPVAAGLGGGSTDAAAVLLGLNRLWSLRWPLARLAEVIERDLGKRVADIPGAGAAGGAGAGLIAFLDATLVPGAPLVVEASGFDAALPGARLVITGEGRVDAQTAYGKAPGEVAKRAHKAGIPVLLLAGAKAQGWESLSSLGVDSIVTLAEDGDPEGHNLQVLMHDAAPELTRAAARAVQELL